ncbi:hypothetical protein DM02DRAFT_104283 [Periconia macrospinosa]|uniref:Uncharacterized protein n=1 Tax=Periconia macrospinosa TaxID=97972 RepID=A0A2V1DGM9_9PLEO|nr:hypothetical protein DM02DRAFT_104283 [Periconia macrospinosa]
MNLITAPGESIGCQKKDKKKCRTLPAVVDPRNMDKDKDKPNTHAAKKPKGKSNTPASKPKDKPNTPAAKPKDKPNSPAAKPKDKPNTPSVKPKDKSATPSTTRAASTTPKQSKSSSFASKASTASPSATSSSRISKTSLESTSKTGASSSGATSGSSSSRPANGTSSSGTSSKTGHSSTPSASSSSSSASSSASASASKYICGQSCGKKGCAVKPTKRADLYYRPRSTARSETFQKWNKKRALGTVQPGKVNRYVLDIIKNAGSDNELDYAYATHFAVSKNGTFVNKPYAAFATGLEGCTGIAVVSKKGYWISHFMEIAFQTDQKPKWDNLWTAVTKGNAKYTIPSTLTTIFGEGTEPVIYIMRPRDADTKKILYDSQIKDIMGKVRTGVLKDAKEIPWEYLKPKDEKELNTVFETTARGKMLIEYDNNNNPPKAETTSSPGTASATATPTPTTTPVQSAAARIFMEDKVYTQEWTATEPQIKGEKETPVDKIPDHRATCLEHASKSITKDDLFTAFNSAFTGGVDIAKPISKTGTFKSADDAAIEVQFNIKLSASQKGCKTSSHTKIMKTGLRSAVRAAMGQCPKGASKDEFMGVKPDVHSSGVGCLDMEIFVV